MSMSKGFAYVLVLVFQTAIHTIAAKPALSSDELTENSWNAKAPATHLVIGGEIA
jgi:hypothetical protein